MSLAYRLVAASGFGPVHYPEPPPPAAAAPRSAWRRAPDALCQLVRDYRPELFSAGGVHGAVLEEKDDGIRALWFRGKLWSREGVPLLATEAWWPQLEALESRYGVPMFFDSEWTEPGGFEATRRTFQTGGAEACGRLRLFDALPLAEWEAGASTLTLIGRKRLLDDAMAQRPLPNLSAMPWQRIWMGKVAEGAAAAIWQRGGEGVVVKDGSSLYTRGRSAAWLRIKCRLTVDCPVVEAIPDRRDPALLGALVVDHEGVRVRVDCTKLPPEDRARAMHYPERLIGRMVEVEAMERTERGSLRSPRLKAWKDNA